LALLVGKFFILSLFIFMALSYTPLYANPAGRTAGTSALYSAPTWGTNHRYSINRKGASLEKQLASGTSSGFITLGALVYFFQKFISPQDGATCPKDPVCSAFGKKALLKFGALKGALMAAERVMRCHGLQDLTEKKDPLPDNFPYGFNP
jgi:putative component of membrane protein insertase Oxa1/YidC/SpoIIIJ protein YidD